MSFTLFDFVQESNRIEGIDSVKAAHFDAHENFLTLDMITPQDLLDFVNIVSPGAKLRDKPGMDVRVGLHVPPAGGPQVTKELERWLAAYGYEPDKSRAYDAHRRFETLHPFTDGNGRLGRALWLWMMGGIENVPLGFLHTWYYQSLQEDR